jgi:hypothetical protein
VPPLPPALQAKSYPITCLRCSGHPRAATFHTISTTLVNCEIHLSLFPPPPHFPRILLPNLFRSHRKVLVEAAPDAILLLSPDERARILFANDQCGHLLQLDSSKPKGQALVERSLWEWMNAQDKAAVVAAIGVCVFCKGATRRLQCTLYSPRSPFALQPRVAMQQQGHQEPQHYHQQWQRQQEAIRADLTFRSSERGLVVFMRPDKTKRDGV